MTEPAEAEPPRRATGRSLVLAVERGAGAVLALWLVWQLALVSLLRTDPALFGRLHDRAGSAVGRVAASLVAVALVVHALLGLRRMLLDTAKPASRRRRAVVDATTAFLVASLSIVASVLVLEPVIEDLLP